MRIGDVNQHNYQQFLQLFGIKGSNALDALLGKNKTKGADEEYGTVEYFTRVARELGIDIEEGMCIIDDNNESWKKKVPVSEEVRDKIIATVRKQFLAGGNGLLSAKDGNEVGAIMIAYRKNIPPAERLSVTWTLSNIYTDEARRLGDYIKKIDPSWTHGKPFDKNILLDSNFGTISKDRVDVKA
jgi:hypothetical protein